MSSNHYENPTTAEEDENAEVKKMGKRSKSRGKRSKSSKKSKTIVERETIKESDEDNNDHLDKSFAKDEQEKQKKSVMITSTTMSTKKQRSQQQQNSTAAEGHNKQTSERQVKLNYFLKKGEISISNHSHNNSTSLLNQQNSLNNTGTMTSKYAITEYERKQSSLEKKLKEKEQILERMKIDKEIHAQRFNKLKYESEEFKLKSKQMMEKQLKEFAKLKREEKAEINPRYGYYKQTSWTVFIEGEALLNSKRKLNELIMKIDELETKKRNSSTEERFLLTAQIDHLNKLLIEHKEEMKKEEAYVNQYKERLRLADKEHSCTIARLGWNLIEDRYLPLELLGSGGFGEVYKAYDLDLNIHVAIKVNCFEPTKNAEHKEDFIKHVQREVATLKELHHPNIVQIIDEIMIDNKISFVLEYCTGPELSKYLAKNEFLTEHEARTIIKQVSFALRYMFNQRHRVIHYDLKPANIMFHNGCVKILDFGLCKKMENEETKIDLTSQGVGTYWYLPPETFMDGAEVSPKVDVWSMGVIFYELLYGRRPFGHGIGQTKIYQEGIILKALKVEFPTDKKFKVSEAAKDFIRECLKYNDKERLDPEQVYIHPYLSQ